MAELPEWMKAYYHALLSTVQEIEEELAPGQLSYQIEYLKEAVKLTTFLSCIIFVFDHLYI